MRSSLRPLFAAAAFSVSLLTLWPALSAAPVEPAPDGTRGPAALAFSADGTRVYVAERDTGEVAVLDAASGAAIGRIPAGGQEPSGLALSPDGKLGLVANRFSGTVGVLDLASRSLRHTIPVPGGPADVEIAADGTAFVAVNQLNEIAVLDPALGKVVARIRTGTSVKETGSPRPTSLPAGARPYALALTPDGKALLCANLSGGSVSRIDVASRREVECLPLPAINLRGLAISADGRQVYVTGQEPGNDRPTENPEAMWRNVLLVLRLDGEGLAVERRVPLDGEQGAADPDGVAEAAGTVFVAAAGSHRLLRVPAGGSGALQFLAVGANPVAVAVRPGTGEVWVANHLGNTLTVLDASGTVRRTVALEPPPRTDRRLRGRFLFASAHLSRGGRFSCSTCHVDGNTEGLSWQFVHVKEGVERRNSRNLRGAVLLTAPYRWSPREEDFEDFVNDEVIGLLGGRKLGHDDLHALWDLVNELPLPPNPYRAPGGGLSPEAQRGKLLFYGKAECGSCHRGAQYGGTARREWIGTTPSTMKLDVPHLTGVYDSAPYLHDGRAVTLEEIFTSHNTQQRHGKAHLLSPAELQALLQFVREL